MNNDNDIFSSFTSNSNFQTSSPTITSSAPSQLETLSLISLSTLETLLETSGELFNSLLEYSTPKEGGDDNNQEELKRQKVLQCYEKYKGFEKELKGHVDNIVEIKNKKKEDKATSSLLQPSISNTANPAIINELIERRDSLLQDSETQETHLTNLLEQTYKLQFQIQTLLACSEQQHVTLPQSDQQQQQQQPE